MTETIKDLDKLLKGMTPTLKPGVFVFVTAPADAEPKKGIKPVMQFAEREGQTLILPVEEAEAYGLTGVFRSRWIELSVHSDLQAVGFLAAITQALAKACVAVNAVSAFHHDHLFVPEDRADTAMAILRALAKGA